MLFNEDKIQELCGPGSMSLIYDRGGKMGGSGGSGNESKTNYFANELG